MDTKKKISDVVLTRFSEKGYGNVFVGHIADDNVARKNAKRGKIICLSG